ncbi:hypothetical protein CCAX7_29060 [Capsulimonas corticalis]|uniref:Uncharacterized protein n=1 Tax=Capsulimonas corticalis TaxID=2219043 RepID=A0A402CT56_9BACT|nr:sigma-70 family RNA polymerase sigma factor [Capsulimonas corticalis]BDI30855.1 hypothetical protein CCAX7_29060 [Capsulimonas corticalis]
MHERRDWELLRAFVETNSQAAFAELTKRYLRLVYATCLREVGDRTQAEDVTQAVFLLLARKAPTFRSSIVLPSWLFDACKYASRNALRGERRRQMREQLMAREVSHTASEAADRVSDLCVGEALDKLAPIDRNVVLLRFICDYTLAETGAAIGISEEAARKRVNRALAKLRTTLTRAGAPLTVAAAAELVQVHHAHAMPANLEAKISEIVQTYASAPLAGAPIPLIAQGAQTAMTLAKVKTIAAITGGLILAGGGVYLAAAKAPHSPRTGKEPIANPAIADTHVAAFNCYLKMLRTYADLKSCTFTETAAGSGAMGMPYQINYAFQRPGKFNIVVTRDASSKRVLYANEKVWTVPEEAPNQASGQPLMKNYTPLMDCLIGAADVKEPFPEMMLDDTRADIDKVVAQDPKAKKMFVLGAPAVIGGVLTDTLFTPPRPDNKDDHGATTFSIGRADHLLYRVVSQDTSGRFPELNFTIDYSDIRVNSKIPANTFEFTPPNS